VFVGAPAAGGRGGEVVREVSRGGLANEGACGCGCGGDVCKHKRRSGKLFNGMIFYVLPFHSRSRALFRSPVAPLARTVMGSETGAELSQEPFKGYNGGGAFPPSCRVLVVAGDLGPVNPMLDESSDGVVGVSETALETPHRRHHVKVWHNMLLFDAKVAETVVDFLNEDDEAELEEGQRMVRSEIQDEVGER